MTTPNNKIDLFDDSKVSPAVKRLADCFNIIAADPQNASIKEDHFLQKGVGLFGATTEGTVPTVFTADEKSYMHMAFLKAATKMVKPIGWQSVAVLAIDKARKLMDAAITMKIIQ